MSKRINLKVFLEEFDDISQLPDDSQVLIQQARENCQTAYAPYSRFLVGAAVLLENGEIISGSNQENAAYPSTLCAERVALFSAAAQFPSVRIHKIAVTAIKAGESSYQPVTPCGGCRQVISEYQSIQQNPIEIIMEAHNGKFRVANSIDVLLPFKFSTS